MIQIRIDEASHRYFGPDNKEYVSVSEVLRATGISQIDKLIAIHGQDHFDMLCRFGKEVHEITAADDRRLHSKRYAKELAPYLQGWCNWRAMAKPAFLAIEQPLASKMGFAGTPDRVALINGKIECPDIKTGTVTWAEEIQTAFYQILIEENYGKKVGARYTVHLDPKYPMGFKINPHRNQNDVNLAKCLITTYNARKEHGCL